MNYIMFRVKAVQIFVFWLFMSKHSGNLSISRYDDIKHIFLKVFKLYGRLFADGLKCCVDNVSAHPPDIMRFGSP